MFRIIPLIFAIFVSFAVCVAQDDTEKVIVKSGTELSVKIDTEIDAGQIKPGADLKFELLRDLVGNGKTFGSGTEMFGRIISVVKFSADAKISKVGLRFDYLKEGEDFYMLTAEVLSIQGTADAIEIDTSKSFEGNTTLSVKGKNLMVETGKEFRIKLVKDVTTY